MKTQTEFLIEAAECRWEPHKPMEGDDDTAGLYPEEFMSRGQFHIAPLQEEPEFDEYAVSFCGEQISEDFFISMSLARAFADSWLQKRISGLNIVVPKKYKHFMTRNPNDVFNENKGEIRHIERTINGMWHIVMEMN